jgi:hypothetical protein
MIIAFLSLFPRKREPSGPGTAPAALDPSPGGWPLWAVPGICGGDGIGARYEEPAIARCKNEA